MRNYLVIVRSDKTEIWQPKTNDWFTEIKDYLFKGGYAECVYPFGQTYPCIIDEEGKFKYPLNPLATLTCSSILWHDYIAGDMAITHFNGCDDMELLTENECNKVLSMIQYNLNKT